jgi:hypothetical protein
VIPAGSPGAGHLLCYDNGLYTKESRWVEVNLPAANPQAIRPEVSQLAESAARTRLGRKLFSDFGGSAQRLPNGNTLLCDGANGRFLQMVGFVGPSQKTDRGVVVWEYVNPYDSGSDLKGAVDRIHFYAPEYCPQFKTLAPAAGAVLMPPDELWFGSEEEQGTSSAVRSTLAVGVSALLAFLLGWWLARRRKRRLQS